VRMKKPTRLLILIGILLFSTFSLTIITLAQQGLEVDCKAIVTKVVDGDTIYVYSEEGFKAGETFKVRLADIDAPELNTPEGLAARSALSSLIDGKEVILDVDDLYIYDKYSRVVAVVYLQVEKSKFMNVNYWLVINNYAKISDYDNEFNPFTWTLYLEYAEEKGETTSAPTVKVVINEVELNPPGRDEGNEWVELYNPNAFYVDLGGWTLTTTHGITVTVTIPEGTRIPPNGYYVVSYKLQWLDNEDESIILKDKNGVEIDRTPRLSDTLNDDNTWQRIPDGRDTDSPEDWKFRASTKGMANSEITSVTLPLSVEVLRTMDKTAVKPGETLTVTLTYTPSGDVMVLVIIEKLPTGFKLVSASPEPKAYNESEGTVMWSFRSTARIEPGTIEYKVLVPKEVGLGTYRIEGAWGAASLTGTAEGMIGADYFEVKKAPSTIMASVSPKELRIGEEASVTGKIEPPHANAEVTLTYTLTGKAEITHKTTTRPDGTFTDVFKPDRSGTWEIQVSWKGDYDHEGAVGKTSLAVEKIRTSLELSPLPKEIEVGKEITVTGKIVPPIADIEVTLTYTKAGEVKITHKVTTASDGTFRDLITPDSGGTWKVKASWRGNEKYEAAESEEMSFEAVERRCIIATATYGSELAPEVQYLRGFREAIVYKTYAGSQFMALFNKFYYSWSPHVAGLIWNYPALKPVAQALLSPLLAILHVATATYQAFSFNSEVGIMVAGLVTCSLIGLVYLAPLFTIVLLILRKRGKTLPRTCQLRPLLALWTASLVLIMLGEITTSTTLTAIATGMLTITTAVLTAGSISLKITSLKLPKLLRK